MTDSRTKPTTTPEAPESRNAEATPADARAGEPKETKADPKLEAQRAERARSLGAALTEIEKSYGRGAIMRLGDDALIKEIRGISSGSPSLDLALGGKGFPRGRIIEVF